MKGTVISLYDYTGEAVKPWAEAGYRCFCFDIQHRYFQIGAEVEKVGDGEIHYMWADLHDPRHIDEIFEEFSNVDFLFSFAPCTHLAVSGARWFEKKRLDNPDFQIEATEHAKMCADLADRFGCPYYIENPVSVLSTLWRKPDYTFHPFEFGGYIPIEEATHPKWAEYILSPFRMRSFFDGDISTKLERVKGVVGLSPQCGQHRYRVFNVIWASESIS